MSKTFVVGDVHGCLHAFERLLERIEFNPKRHGLWLVGDIVNRGPDSLAMLRRAIKLERKMGERFRMVLGNHEMHLLGVAAGYRRLRAGDTLNEILDAADSNDLLAWLRKRPFAYWESGYLLVHAGLLPQWSRKRTKSIAQRLERQLRKRKGRQLLDPHKAHPMVDVFTRLRMLDRKTRSSGYSGSPENAPAGLEPWYESWVRRQRKAEKPTTVLFGHWAALGQRHGGHGTRKWISLDSGCVYGRSLSAVRLPKGGSNSKTPRAYCVSAR